jgi:predicted Zn-dependent protease
MNSSAWRGSAAPSDRLRTIEAQRVLPVLFSVLALMAILALIDMWLVRIATRHRFEVGEQLFNRGVSASQTGRQRDALELFRGAFNHSPRNAEYQLALARSLNANGRIAESKTVIQNLLDRSPTHGDANAEFARMLASEGLWQDAAWYYHRALYGEWAGSPDLRSLRFELADLLARHNDKQQLLAEVLMLDATGGRALDARHMARLSLAAEDWMRAEREYRALLAESPNDPGLLVGLARAQFGAGKYLAAERTFRRSLSAGAGSDASKLQLALAASVNQLDPTLRRLPAVEKHRRSHELASMLVQALTACSPHNAQLVQAEAAMQTHVRSRNAFADSEADLELFEQLWAARNDICPSSPSIPEPVQLLAAQLMK